MSEIATFRMYPGLGNYEHSTGRRGLYFVVRVYDTLGDMRKCCVEDGMSAASFFSGAYGACQKWVIVSIKPKRGKRKGPPARTKESGQIMLCRKHLGIGIVSHECVHAAIYWFNRLVKGDGGDGQSMRLPQNRKEEEMLCYGVGEMTRQVYIGLEKAGVLTVG